MLPKAFLPGSSHSLKDCVENTWDKCNSAVPVQNSDARSVRTRCKTVGFLGAVNHHQHLQRQHSVSGDTGSLFCRNTVTLKVTVQGEIISLTITNHHTLLLNSIQYTVSSSFHCLVWGVSIACNRKGLWSCFCVYWDTWTFAIQLCKGQIGLKKINESYLVYLVVSELSSHAINSSLIASKSFYM